MKNRQKNYEKSSESVKITVFSHCPFEIDTKSFENDTVRKFNHEIHGNNVVVIIVNDDIISPPPPAVAAQ